MRIEILTILIILALSSPVLAADSYDYGSITIEGTYANLIMDSETGAWVESSSAPSDYYAFWQEYGVDFEFEVTDSSKTLDYAYLYFGDGTGQSVSESTSYNRHYLTNADFRPALIVVFTDSTSEEILGQLTVETFNKYQVLLSRPGSFTPPTTAQSVVNSYLANNGHTTLSDDDYICICGSSNIWPRNCGKRYIDGDSDCKDTAGTADCFDECP